MNVPYKPEETSGFVTLRYVQSDGSSGEVVYDCSNAGEVFHKMRLAGLPAGRPCPKNQLVLDLTVAERQAAEHTFS